MTVRSVAVSFSQGNNQHFVTSHRKSKKNCCKKAALIAGNVLMTVSSSVMIFGVFYLSSSMFVRGASYGLGMHRISALAHQHVINGLWTTLAGTFGCAMGHMLKRC